MRIYRMRFPIQAGMLVRGEVRSALNDLKSSIVFNNPKAKVDVTESRGFLDSTFYFNGSELTEQNMSAINKFKTEMERALND